MLKKLIAILLTVLIVTSLFAIPAAADSYSGAFNCLKDYAMEGDLSTGDTATAMYSNSFYLDDFGNVEVAVHYYLGTDENYWFPEEENTAPLVELVFVNYIDGEGPDWFRSRTWIRFCQNQRDSCTVYLDVDPGPVYPYCQATATIHPAAYTGSTNITFDRYYGESSTRAAFEQYAQDTLSLLLE